MLEIVDMILRRSQIAGYHEGAGCGDIERETPDSLERVTWGALVLRGEQLHRKAGLRRAGGDR
jgi:predicted protein tyrosine phosphatase